MPAPDEWTNDGFLAPHAVEVLDARGRYEYLLRVVRFLLVRGVSFSSIEERLVEAGIPPDSAEQLVELVIQATQGRVHPPGAYPEVDVSPAVLDALGFSVDGVQLHAGSPLEAAVRGPAPEFAFAARTSDASEAAVNRARQSYRTFLLVLALLAGLLAVALATAVIGTWSS